MFVVTAKMSKKGLIAAACAVFAVLCAVGITIITRSSTPYDGDAAMTAAAAKKSVAAATNDERREFLAQFGWEADADAREFYEVTIPKTFDKVYEHYNELQKAQGFDLARYRGKAVMKYSYVIRNYPGEEGAVYATLLVWKNKVIGGDVCSARLDGFMHGFEKPAASSAAETSAEANTDEEYDESIA